jgi:parvulin-like peptidyl-prolyl isomerase
MKQKAKSIMTLYIAGLAISLFCIGCGSKEKYGKYTEEQMQQIGLPMGMSELPAPTGATMALDVQSETISSDEILAITESILKPAAPKMDEVQFKTQARPIVREAIRGKVTDILLYQEARKSAPENIDDLLNKAVDAEIANFVASCGNDYALAESRLREQGMDWRSFREYQKKLIMTQSYVSNKFKTEKRFSQQQLRDFYQEYKYDIPGICGDSSVGFSVIDIQPDRLTTQQVAEGETPQAAAERIADELIVKLNEGADFAALAKQYHGDLAAIGGKVTPVKIEDTSLTEPYRSLKEQALQMQPGQIAGPIVLDGQVFVLKLDTLEAGGCKPFDQVQLRIEQLMLNQERQRQYEQLVEKLIKKTDIAQMDRFTDFCIEQAYLQWGQS